MKRLICRCFPLFSIVCFTTSSPCTYADDPKQVPFLNAENQIENRWIVEAHIQVNPSITIPQQFAGTAVVGIVSVQERFPTP